MRHVRAHLRPNETDSEPGADSKPGADMRPRRPELGRTNLQMDEQTDKQTHPPTLCCYFTSRALMMQMEPDKNFFQMPTVNPVLCL